jgi:hypothetical protein
MKIDVFLRLVTSYLIVFCMCADVEFLQDELEKAKRLVTELMQQKNASETAFGQQRAKFMELFRNKEGCMLI